jgi:penicillin amidase
MNDVDTIFRDINVVMARDWVPLILSSVKGNSLNSFEQEALESLSKWNFESQKEQLAPLVFQATLVSMVQNAFYERLGKGYYELYIESPTQVMKALKHIMSTDNSPWFDDISTSVIEDRNNFLSASFKDAVKMLEEKIGNNVDDWRLGKLLTLTLTNSLSESMPFAAPLFNVETLPMDGGWAVPRSVFYKLTNPFEVVGGSIARVAVDMSDLSNAKIINMPGISGNFMSPHYDDQVKLWYELKYRPFGLHKHGQMEHDSKYVLNLLPE